MKDASKLTNEELLDVSGGMIYNAAGTPEADPDKPWETIQNSTGQVLGRYATRDEACFAAKQYKADSKYDTLVVTKEQVDYLRAHPQA